MAVAAPRVKRGGLHADSSASGLPRDPFNSTSAFAPPEGAGEKLLALSIAKSLEGDRAAIGSSFTISIATNRNTCTFSVTIESASTGLSLPHWLGTMVSPHGS